MHSKALEESYDLVSQRLRKTEAENCKVRERTQLYHEQNKEAMDSQEEFFKDQLKALQNNLDGKAKNYKDQALTQLFMMNNNHYIVRSVRRSDAKDVLGDD